MVETRIKPHFEQTAKAAEPTEQRRLYRRNQAIGIVILAAAICVRWLFQTYPAGIFPPGWWRP